MVYYRGKTTPSSRGKDPFSPLFILHISAALTAYGDFFVEYLNKSDLGKSYIGAHVMSAAPTRGFSNNGCHKQTTETLKPF